MTTKKTDKKKKPEKKKIVHKDKRVPTEKDLKIIEEDSFFRLSHIQIARHLDISEDLFLKWRRHYPRVSSAIRAGISRSDKRANACIYMQAFPVDHLGKPTGNGDSKLMMFWAERKMKWQAPEKKIKINQNDGAIPVIQYAIKEPVSEKETEKTDKEN